MSLVESEPGLFSLLEHTDVPCSDMPSSQPPLSLSAKLVRAQLLSGTGSERQ